MGYGLIDEKPWLLVRAAPTYNACEVGQAEFIKKMVTFWAKVGPDTVSATGNTVVLSVRDGEGKQVGVVTHHLSCLPDTVDPRGPKGK
jgi:hypothetical protein